MKVYQLYGIDTAMRLLRPGALWEICDGVFTRWEDSRPCPSWKEVVDTMEKIKAFEDSIDTIWLPEQIESLRGWSDTQQQVMEMVNSSPVDVVEEKTPSTDLKLEA